MSEREVWVTPNPRACGKCGEPFTAERPEVLVGDEACGYWKSRFSAHRECITITGNQSPPAVAESAETPYPVPEPDAEPMYVPEGAWPAEARATVARLTAENAALQRAHAEAIGWLAAILERRDYEDNTELRELLEMLSAARSPGEPTP